MEELNIKQLLKSARKQFTKGIKEDKDGGGVPGCLARAYSSVEILFEQGGVEERNYLIGLLDDDHYAEAHAAILGRFVKLPKKTEPEEPKDTDTSSSEPK